MRESDGHHQKNCRDCRGLPEATAQEPPMEKLKRTLENKAKMEDAKIMDIDSKIMDIDSKINKLQVERTFHVGLHTAYLNSLAELEKEAEVD